jgi:hypothetical protein
MLIRFGATKRLISGDRYPFMCSVFCSAGTGPLIFGPFGDVYSCWEEIGDLQYRISPGNAGPHEGEPVAIELARLLLKAGDYQRILDVLCPLLAVYRFAEEDELMARMYVVLAAAATGDSEEPRASSPESASCALDRPAREGAAALKLPR